ncbi:MAG: RDD family protein [Bdellovibrionota bacterium]
MDSFDDFEFKPITEGLGFHKKTSGKNKKNSEPLPALESKFSSTLDGLNSNSLKFDTPLFSDLKAQTPKMERLDNPSLEKKIELPELTLAAAPSSPSLFSKPLPRTEKDIEKKPLTSPSPAIPKFNPRFGKPLSNPSISDSKIQDSGLLSVLEGKSLNAPTMTSASEISKAQIKPNKVDATLEIKYIETAPSPLSLFLDLTVIAGLSILFMLGLVVATGLDLVPILTNAGSDTGTQIGVVLLAYSVSQLYLILARSFFGQTLGEWSMDTQLGKSSDQEKISYAFKLIARTLILTATGFIVLPLISMILNKDLAGRAADLKLYRR